MSRLLLDEQPLLVMPQLAAKIGLNESIILQQIHYWNEINKSAKNNYRDGHYWTFNSYEEWQKQFPFWATRTIQRTFTNLEKMKLVVVGNYNKLKIDRTKWYRIDYKALKVLEESPFGQIGTSTMTEWLDHLAVMSPPLPEINSESSSEIKKNKRYTIHENGGQLFSYYAERFKERFGKDHPTITESQLEELKDQLAITMLQNGYSNDDVKEMIDIHFEKLSSKNDGKIFSFIGQNETINPMIRYSQDLDGEIDWDKLL